LDVGRGNMVECEITTGPLRIKITIFWKQGVIWEAVPTASFVLWRWRHFYQWTKLYDATFWVTGIFNVTQVTKIFAMTDTAMPISYNVFYVYLPAMLLIFQKTYLCIFQCDISDCKQILTTHHYSKTYRFSFSSEKEETPVVSCLIVSVRRGLKACL
jgi:hypothetical protein